MRPRLQQALDAPRVDRPDFALGERLPEVREIGERGHRFDAVVGQLLAGGVEIELAFQVVHAGFQERFAVQFAPQADGAELLALGERLVGEVAGDFFGREIDVGENHDAGIAAARSPARPNRLRGRRRTARGSGSPSARAWRSDAGTRRGWSGTCDDRGWPSRGRARFCRSYCTAPARLRLCQYSRSAAKNRSQAQSVPMSSAAAANSFGRVVESLRRLSGSCAARLRNTSRWWAAAAICLRRIRDGSRSRRSRAARRATARRRRVRRSRRADTCRRAGR